MVSRSSSLRLQVVPAPEIPGSGSKAKGASRKYQDWAIFLRGDALRGGDGIFGNPLWPGVGIVAAWFAAGTCCSGNDRVALPSRCHGSLAQRGCDRFRIKSQEGKELGAF